MPPKNRKQPQRWSMHPEQHGAVSSLLADDDLHLSFHGNDSDSNRVRDYDTNITGRFICRNEACKKSGWSSNVVPITIRLYPRGQYNARVYHQRCKQCDFVSKPHLDDTYAERVAYRLKKWHGVEMEEPAYGPKTDKPHRMELCEGCKAGHCRRMMSDFR